MADTENDTVLEEVENSDIDFALGGPVKDHSPDVHAGADVNSDSGHSGGDEAATPAKADSAATDASVDAELDRLNKRLHDTQAAYHEETQKRANLEKELAELRKRDDVSEDDWFGDGGGEKSDAGAVSDVEGKIAESEKAISEHKAAIDDINMKAAEAIWDREAKRVIAEHPDFEQVVYGELYGAIQPGGDAYIRDMWEKSTDKSPQGAYDFAIRMRDIMEIQRDPVAYREKVRRELKAEMGFGESVISGSDGLAMLNSEGSSADPGPEGSNDDIDFVLRR